MFGERFMECFAPLYPRRDIADDGPQRSLPFWIGLFVQSSQSLHQRNTCLDNGGKLPGKENQIGLFYLSGFPTRVLAVAFRCSESTIKPRLIRLVTALSSLRAS